jgi:spore germination protein (amino acid permease)
MLPLPKENKQVSPYLAFYLITTMQIGVGILGFERYVARPAGHDAWIAVIASGFSINILIWMCYRILNSEKNDIIVVHQTLFGKWLGGLLSCYLVVYFLAFVVTITRTYIEVVQVWMFPEIDTWLLALFILTLAYSFITGGFRVVAGLCLLAFFFTVPLFLLKYYALKEAHFSNLLPVFDHSVKELLLGTKAMTLNYLGFEVLLMFYPFFKRPEKSEKWAHYGNFFSIFTYVVTIIVSLLYYNQEQLKHTVWATLTLWKVVDLPFAERFEYAGVAIWLFVVLPNICLGIWSASRGIKQMFLFKQRNSVRIIIPIIFLGCILLKDRQQIDLLNNTVSNVGFYTIYFYIPILFLVQFLIKKAGKRNYG